MRITTDEHSDNQSVYEVDSVRIDVSSKECPNSYLVITEDPMRGITVRAVSERVSKFEILPVSGNSVKLNVVIDTDHMNDTSSTGKRKMNEN